jgi:hypothetical protein
VASLCNAAKLLGNKFVRLNNVWKRETTKGRISEEEEKKVLEVGKGVTETG